jgi:ATP-dependent DNA helicase RecG
LNINIPRILQQGEGISIEFKRAKDKLPETLFDTVCAFLNRNGGTVLLGVLDNGIVEGVDPGAAKQMLKDIANLSNNPQKLTPSFLFDVSTVEYEGKTVIHLFVPASSQVHSCGNKIFDRSADGDFELKTTEQIKNCYIRKNNTYTENTIFPYLYETDFVPGIVERVRRMIKNNRPDHPWNELSDADFFRQAGLYRRDLATNIEGFTMATLLLFGKDEVIMSAVPHYKIDCLLRRQNMERYDDRENIRCNLVESYDKIMAFVAKHLPDKFYMEGDLRISLREHLFREIVANLLIHREYTNAFPSTFIIYSNKVEAKNANRPHLYGRLTLNNFEPFPKNPHIAQIFTQIGRSEELGTGLRKVYKYSKAYSDNDHIIFNEEDIFVQEIPLNADFFENIDDYINEVPNKVPNEVPNEVPNITMNQKRILEEIKNNNHISMYDLSAIIGISKRKILVNITKLKQFGWIERVGGTRGYWIIKINF